MLVILLYLNKSRNLQTPPNLSPPTGTYSMPSAPACAKRCTRPAFSGYLGLGSSASGSGCAFCYRTPWLCWPSAPRHRPAWRQCPCRWRRFPGQYPLAILGAAGEGDKQAVAAFTDGNRQVLGAHLYKFQKE